MSRRVIDPRYCQGDPEGFDGLKISENAIQVEYFATLNLNLCFCRVARARLDFIGKRF